MKNKGISKIRFGCATFFLLFLVSVFVYVDYMSYAKRKMAYTYHVTDYVIEQKRKNEKWPVNLDGFSQSEQSRSAGGQAFHRNNFQSMTITTKRR